MSQKKRNRSLEESFQDSSSKIQRDSSLKRDERKRKNKQKIEEIAKQLKSKLLTQNIKENIKVKPMVEQRKKEFTRDLMKISPKRGLSNNMQLRIFSEENSFNLNDDLSANNISQSLQVEILKRDTPNNTSNTTTLSNINQSNNALIPTTTTPTSTRNRETQANEITKQTLEEDFDRFRARMKSKEKRIDIMSIGSELKGLLTKKNDIVREH